jgi:membrane-associated phospholipid phosphatase
LPHNCAPKAGWLRQAWLRGLTFWPVKVIGLTLGMTVFFTAYFGVLHHPLFSVTTMPFTAVDRLVSFQPEALLLYLSLWFYVSLVPALLIQRRELMFYALAAAGISAIGLGIFLLWPTTVDWADADWSRYPAFAFLQSVDASGNACPSLHVAFAVFTAVLLGRLLRQLGAGRGVCAFNWLWCLGILYSTIAIRQHVMLDVLAGAGLGAVTAVMYLRRCPNAFDFPLAVGKVN